MSALAFAAPVLLTPSVSKRRTSCKPVQLRRRITPFSCAITDRAPAQPPAASAALLPVTVVGATVAALSKPALFAWFQPAYSAPCLAAIMLAMGLTLRPEEFSRVAKHPARLLLGAAAQYSIMPALAASVARALALPPPLALGVILTGCCPGGAASNIVCLFAGADVAYSVLLTLTSTALSVALTPLLVLMLAGSWMPIDPFAILASVAQVVILPLFIGGAIQAAAPAFVSTIEPILPFISVVLVGLIVASVMSTTAPIVLSCAPRIIAALALLHGLGAVLGYMVAAIARLAFRKRRTLAIEVCMQNSTLASSLATAHFADPLVAVPGAISATLHSVLGSLLAALWRISDSMRARAAKAEQCTDTHPTV